MTGSVECMIWECGVYDMGWSVWYGSVECMVWECGVYDMGVWMYDMGVWSV